MAHNAFDIVPEPRRLEAAAGSFDPRGATVAFAPGLEGPARLLASWLGGAVALAGGGWKPGTERAVADAAAPLPVEPAPAPGGARQRSILLRLDPALTGTEEHRLRVGPGSVELDAGGAEGAVRAAVSLWQLALSSGGGRGAPLIPCCAIEDGPRFPWRGAMLDTARNFQPVDFLERFLDWMALHKLNRFHWHLTDDQAWRLEVPGLPELAGRGSRRLDRRVNGVRWKEGSYSPDDLRRVVAFAAARGIVVVPEIETPGHVTALLASHPELSCAGMASAHPLASPGFEPEDRHGIFEDVLCAGNEEVFGLLGKVFDHLAAVFPGPWVHAGGDEVPKARWMACPRCRALMKAEGLRDPGGALEPELLQGWFMNRVAELLAARGKRMVGWDEILEGEPRKDAIVMSWRGYAGGIEAARAGHEVVMSPQTKACYLDHKHLDLPGEPGQLGVCTVRDAWEFEPLPAVLTEEEGRRILGAQANLWTELMYFGRQVEYMAYPRLSALAESFWSPKGGRSFSDFSARLPTHGRRLELLGINWYRGPLE